MSTNRGTNFSWYNYFLSLKNIIYITEIQLVPQWANLMHISSSTYIFHLILLVTPVDVHLYYTQTQNLDHMTLINKLTKQLDSLICSKSIILWNMNAKYNMLNLPDACLCKTKLLAATISTSKYQNLHF